MSKRRIAFIVFAFAFFSLAAWRQLHNEKNVSPYQEVDTLEDVWIEAKPGTVTPYGMVILIHNTAERGDYETGDGYVVEKKRGDQWYTIPGSRLSFDMPGPLIAYLIPTASEIEQASAPDGGNRGKSRGSEWTYGWSGACGELPPGDYRLLLEVDAAEDIHLEGYEGPWYLSAPFTIS